MTTISTLLPELKRLTRQEKWEAMQFLVRELAEEDVSILEPNQSYPIWSPHDAFEAGQTLLNLLEAEKAPAQTNA